MNLETTAPQRWPGATRQRRPAAGRGRLRAELARRPYLAPALLALAMVAVTVSVAAAAGLPIKDPDGIFGERARLLLGTVVAFMALDIVPRAIRRAGWRPLQMLAAARTTFRERWTWRRTALALGGILSFYLTYVGYRNLKSYLPALVDQDLDVPLRELERSAFLGTDPATLLHDVLGTGVVAHVLSAVYVFFLAFVPISVATALIWSRRTGPGCWYTMALGLNWTLGVIGYYVLPALGPIFVFPSLFESLPDTATSALQATLVEERALVLADAAAAPVVQSIAAFPSLHVSIVFTAALIAHHLRLYRPLRVFLWTFLALTIVATVYFGWHYLVDDVAAIAIGAAAVYLAAAATGQRIRPRSASGHEQDHVVAGDDREQRRVEPVEQPAVRPQQATAVLDLERPLDEALEQVADRGGERGRKRYGERGEAVDRRGGDDEQAVARERADRDAGQKSFERLGR